MKYALRIPAFEMLVLYYATAHFFNIPFVEQNLGSVVWFNMWIIFPFMVFAYFAMVIMRLNAHRMLAVLQARPDGDALVAKFKQNTINANKIKFGPLISSLLPIVFLYLLNYPIQAYILTAYSLVFQATRLTLTPRWESNIKKNTI
jgi:hypothetical protein